MAKWVLKNKGTTEYRKKIAEQYNISEAFAQILINKQIETEYEEYATEHPENDPLLLKDMKKAATILLQKIKDKKKIRICGDMDVDGIMATEIGLRAISYLGGIVDYDIPHRIHDGYGLNVRMVKDAINHGIDTLLTVDNGIAANEAIAYAVSHGLTVVVTDHHEVPYEMDADGKKEWVYPDADAIVDPKQPTDTYPFNEICGAMISYKLAKVLFAFEKKEFVLEDTLKQFAAIATVCDIMDLVDENRTFVIHGIQLLNETKIAGLKAMMEVSDIASGSLSLYHIGFVLGPMLNASGRLDTAKDGVDLLSEEDYEKALTKANRLKLLNDERKQLTDQGVELARKDESIETDKVLVLYVPNIHESVAGIIAGRIKDEFHKPTIVLTDTESGGLKGSGRSIPHYNMFEELNKAKPMLSKFGGHEMAAGLSLDKENLVPFRTFLNETTTLTEGELEEKISIDLNMPLNLVSEYFINELKTLEPYGKGNPKPVLAERNVAVKKADIIGKKKNVLKLRLETKSGLIDGLYFGDPKKFLDYYTEKYSKEDVENMLLGFDNNVKLLFTYNPDINEFRGQRNIQVIINQYC